MDREEVALPGGGTNRCTDRERQYERRRPRRFASRGGLPQQPAHVSEPGDTVRTGRNGIPSLGVMNGARFVDSSRGHPPPPRRFFSDASPGRATRPPSHLSRGPSPDIETVLYSPRLPGHSPFPPARDPVPSRVGPLSRSSCRYGNQASQRPPQDIVSHPKRPG